MEFAGTGISSVYSQAGHVCPAVVSAVMHVTVQAGLTSNAQKAV